MQSLPCEFLYVLKLMDESEDCPSDEKACFAFRGVQLLSVLAIYFYRSKFITVELPIIRNDPSVVREAISPQCRFFATSDFRADPEP
jgi:hypothetical protein